MSPTLAPEPPFHGINRQMGKLIDRLQKGYHNFAPGEVWAPSVNLYETDCAYLLCVDLAGVEKEKIDITVEDRILRLHGHRMVPACEEPAKGDSPCQKVRVHLMEIDHGSFSRDVELPVDVQQDNINARYRDGMLWVELPKK